MCRTLSYFRLTPYNRLRKIQLNYTKLFNIVSITLQYCTTQDHTTSNHTTLYRIAFNCTLSSSSTIQHSLFLPPSLPPSLSFSLHLFFLPSLPPSCPLSLPSPFRVVCSSHRILSVDHWPYVYVRSYLFKMCEGETCVLFCSILFLFICLFISLFICFFFFYYLYFCSEWIIHLLCHCIYFLLYCTT